MAPGICFEFSKKGTCKFKRCKFRHIQDGQGRSRDEKDPKAKPSKPHEGLSNAEREFRAWRSNIPLNVPTTHSIHGKLAFLFREARRLIDVDVGIRQSVIQTLSGEGGLYCIKELIEQDLGQMPTARKGEVFKASMVPFLEIISHPDILSSLVLEQAVGTIYNIVFGINGLRASNLLRHILDVLIQNGRGNSTVAWLELSLLVFSRIVDLNSTALVQDPLKQQAKTFEEILIQWSATDTESALDQSRAYLERILRRLEIGSSLPTGKPQTQSHAPKSAGGFVTPCEPPGGRHDNDHLDICQIRILPSFQEISSTRAEYLPVNDPTQWHINGLDGLLDRNFRLLREDTIGQLRDAIHSVMQPSRKLRNQKNVQSTNAYHPSRISRLGFDRMNGLQFEVEFPQPANVAAMPTTKREEWWRMSKRLQGGALVCLISQQKSVQFCTVVESRYPGSSRQDQNRGKEQQNEQDLLWKSPQRASVLLELSDGRNRDIEAVLNLYHLDKQALVLLELPGVLLPAFEPTLKALQLMKSTGNLPLSEFLVPHGLESSGLVNIPPPVYATKPGFEFNLSCLMNDGSNFYVHPSRPANLQRLRQSSSLDDAQATALVDSLQRKVALIQGPPGTGKSYTGVALIKVLLANKIHGKTKIGPIICVTYTNHALDQLLESLLDNKITTQIVRIGSQSKSDVLEPYKLRAIAKDSTRTKMEKAELWNAHQSMDGCDLDFDGIGCARDISNTRLMVHLRDKHPSHYQQFHGPDEGGFETARGDKKKKVMNRWLHSGALGTGETRPVEELEATHLTGMSRPERQKLYAHWKMEIKNEIRGSLLHVCEAHRNAKREYSNIRDEVDLRCLSQADVIGVTTSGLARNLNMLRRLQSKVMMCEEAGEVLEAHLLTALLPSVEHAILIGDHLQLRPQVQNYDLSRENVNGGTRYSLDVSLFERLVESSGPMDSGLPYSTLETQRRMHPSIAQLIRDTLYPRLNDSPSVHDYPEVGGMRKRLFWLDHRMEEANPSNADATATSRWNDYEIDMATALVNHLVRQGKYGSHDIAVLTPYLGQLHRLRRRLGESHAITLGDRDQDDLDKAGFQDENVSSPAAVRSTLLQSLRVATIDNFQGEEAKVVVITLVRSNPQNRCGFLRTSNRINVLLSRAKHGMYIIGNSATSTHVPMWADVIGILQRNENIGMSLELQCPRHPDTPIAVSKPDDFPRVSPEGGCDLRCAYRLPCGHACVQKCHSDILHNAVFCLEPCPRPRQGCSHPCPKKCGDPCPQKCTVNVFQEDRKLPCGHLIQSLPCWQSQDLWTVRCPTLVRKTVLNCKHEATVACHIDVNSPQYTCKLQCRASLGCGHECKNRCFMCVKRSDSGEVQIDHGVCRQLCGRNQNTCTHRCTTPCHGEQPCPPCQSPCEVDCGHSRCAQKCSDPCTPCAEDTCFSSCPHSTCTMPCAAPCDHIPCSKRCDKLLDCGHQCPSVCGERCPPATYCQVCGTEDIKNHMVDFILGETYKEIDLDKNPCVFPKCGHFLTIESMDAQMDLKQYYTLDAQDRPVGIAASLKPFSIDDIKTCASCRGSLRDIARYGRLVRRAILDESTKKLILFMNREYLPLAQQLPVCVRQLQETKHQGTIDWPAHVVIAGQRNVQVNTMRNIISPTKHGRWKDVLALRQQIARYLNRVKPEEQPYSRVRSMVETARRRQNTPKSFEFGDDILQTKGLLQAVALSLRLDIALLADFLQLRRDCPKGSQSDVEIDLSAVKAECESLTKGATENMRIAHQTEGYVFLAEVHALERSHAKSPEAAEEHLRQGTIAIDHAKSLSGQFPGQTRGLVDEIEGAEKMLKGSTFYTMVTNEERMAVIAAMAREFRGTGHWYYCRNGHPFTIGECGMAMQRSSCPECGSPVGGQNHRSEEGVTHARNLEGDFARMGLD